MAWFRRCSGGLPASGFLLVACLTSCAPTNEAFQNLDRGWQVTIASRGSSGPALLDQHLPGSVLFAEQGWVDASVAFALSPDVAYQRETWIVVGKVDFPFEARLNGVLIHRRGVFPPAPPFAPSSQPSVFLVPSTLWRWSGVNELSLRIWKTGNRLYFPDPVRVVGPLMADFQLGPVWLLNSTVFLVFFGINMLTGLYFLLLWMGRRSDRDQLWFALSTLCIGLYFLGLGSPVQLLPGVLHFSVAKAFLGPAIGFLILFLLAHFRVWTQPSIKYVVMGVYTVDAFYVGGAPDINALADRFTVSMVPLELGILLALAITVVALHRRRPQASIIATGSLIGVAFGTHDVLYQVFGLVPLAWLQGVGFFAFETSMFVSLALHANRTYRELQQQQEILARSNQAYARFLPADLVRLAGPISGVEGSGAPDLGGDVTVLCSEIRNFPALSEILTPRDSYQLLNSYLSRMGPIIRDHHGMVDRYMGDVLMAWFPQSPQAALNAALAMKRSLSDHNAGRLRAGYRPLELGIGLHTGPVGRSPLAPTASAPTEHAEASAIACLIDGLAKKLGLTVLVSEATLHAHPALKDAFPHRYVGTLSLAEGRGLTLYEVLDPAEPLTALKLTHRPLFERAVRAAEASPTRAASELFRVYAELVPDDPCLDYFRRRELL